jgi:transmembrane sensor
MHPDRAMTDYASLHTPPRPLDRGIATQAARWFILLTSGEASMKEQRAFDAWLRADAEHERAWQRAQQVSRTAGQVPAGIGKTVLCRPDATTRERRRAVKHLLLLMAVAPAGWLAFETMPWRVWTADYATATGVRRSVTLPDGTVVELNTSTAIDIAFDAQQRTLWLREGEIMVSTAHDPFASADKAARPLLVITSHGQIHPVGTRFIVRQHRERSDVAVLEGAVELRTRNGAAMHLLKAGWAASFTETQIGQDRVLPSGSDAWTRGIVVADDMRLDQLLAELGRYRSGFLTCDPQLASRRVTGAFQINHTDGALANIAQLLSVDLHYRTRYWVSLIPSQKNN